LRAEKTLEHIFTGKLNIYPRETSTPYDPWLVSGVSLFNSRPCAE
jgi:hypothetical protein